MNYLKRYIVLILTLGIVFYAGTCFEEYYLTAKFKEMGNEVSFRYQRYIAMYKFSAQQMKMFPNNTTGYDL